MRNHALVQTGYWNVGMSIPHGKVPEGYGYLKVFHIHFNDDGSMSHIERGEGDGELMTQDEADAFCLERGYLQYFADTEAFIRSLRFLLTLKGRERGIEAAKQRVEQEGREWADYEARVIA